MPTKMDMTTKIWLEDVDDAAVGVHAATDEATAANAVERPRRAGPDAVPVVPVRVQDPVGGAVDGAVRVLALPTWAWADAVHAAAAPAPGSVT
jgi:hypothetical protein